MVEVLAQTPETEISNPQPEVDTSAALADISSELFGQGSDDTPVEGAETPAEPSPVVESPPTEGETAQENTEAVKETGAPETWTKEALQEWAAIPPRAQQEIMKREADFHKGIEQYREAASVGQQYDSVIEPFKPLLQAENLDPVQMFQSFASNHYLLSRGTPEQKLEITANLIEHYGVSLSDLVDLAGHRALNPPDPRMTSLESKLDQLLAAQQQPNQPSNQVSPAQQAAALSEVETFAKDPAHPFFDELVNDIATFMERDPTAGLQAAYDSAVFANPATRQKEIDRLTALKLTESGAAEKARKDKIAKASAADVRAGSHQRDGTVPLGSMDDTLNATLAEIESRG